MIATVTVVQERSILGSSILFFQLIVFKSIFNLLASYVWDVIIGRISSSFATSPTPLLSESFLINLDGLECPLQFSIKTGTFSEMGLFTIEDVKLCLVGAELFLWSVFVLLLRWMDSPLSTVEWMEYNEFQTRDT